MSLNVEDPDSSGRMKVSAAEDNSCSVGRPGGVPLVLEVFRYHFARPSAIGRNCIQFTLLGRRAARENDLLAVGRPPREHGPERRVAELESLAAVQFADPNCSLRLGGIGTHCPSLEKAAFDAEIPERNGTNFADFAS